MPAIVLTKSLKLMVSWGDKPDKSRIDLPFAHSLIDLDRPWYVTSKASVMCFCNH